MLDFWEESFWLPSNTSWNDLENGPDKGVVYCAVKDLWVQVPLVAIIFLLRWFCEKNILKPFGKYLNISNGRIRKVPENVLLEVHYRKSAKLENLSSIAKKVEMSEREVERWWRLRRSQDRPSTLVKFTESMWKFSCYLCLEAYAARVLWTKDWVWNVDLSFKGYPHQGVTNDLKWYYMISTGFYWSLTISQFWDVKRKDYFLMFLHHVATVILLTLSWICNLHRTGAIILFLHDCSDAFLELAKTAKYARAESLAKLVFGMFVVVWTSMRLYTFPVAILFRNYDAIIYDEFRFRFPMNMFLNALLLTLMVVNIFWTWLIAKLMVKMSRGEETGDIRSSDSESNATDSETIGN